MRPCGLVTRCGMLCPSVLAGYQVQSSDVAGGNKTLLTGDDQYILRIASAAAGGRTAGSNNRSMVLTDVQQSKANVVDGPFVPENNDGMSVYLVDKVLRSGECIMHGCRMYHLKFATGCKCRVASSACADAGLCLTVPVCNGSVALTARHQTTCHQHTCSASPTPVITLCHCSQLLPQH